MNLARLTEELGPLLAQFGLELDRIDAQPSGRRTVLRVTVDGDGPEGRGPSLDDIADATRAISSHLDDSPSVGKGTFTLEVTSPGIDRPLTKPAHWRRNTGRLVRITTGGEVVEGRIQSADDDEAVVVVDGAETAIPYANIEQAVVQAELTKTGRKD